MITADTLRPAIAANVKRLRIEKDLTQEQLAEKVGLSAVFVNRIERAKSSVSAEVLFALADALGVTADQLRQVS